MRSRTLLIPALLLLAACTAPEEPAPTTEPTTAATEAPAEATERAATASPSAEPAEATAVPEQCTADGNIGPVWETLEDTDLPATAMIADVDEFPPMDPSKNTTVVQVTVCSVPMNRDETREVASLLATAAQDYDGPGIYRMDVTIQHPDGGQLAEGRHVFVEDYGSIVWDRPPAETARFWTEV